MVLDTFGFSPFCPWKPSPISAYAARLADFGQCQKSFYLELEKDTALILTLKTPIMTNCTAHFCDQYIV